MNDGELEILISKVSEATLLHANKLADMIRAYYRGCSSNVTVEMADKATEFSPPFASPTIDTAELGAGKVTVLPPHPRTRILQAKYRFLLSASPQNLEAIRALKVECGQLGVTLPADGRDTTGTGPVEELLAHAVGERNQAVEKQNEQKQATGSSEKTESEVTHHESRQQSRQQQSRQRASTSQPRNGKRTARNRKKPKRSS